MTTLSSSVPKFGSVETWSRVVARSVDRRPLERRLARGEHGAVCGEIKVGGVDCFWKFAAFASSGPTGSPYGSIGNPLPLEFAAGKTAQ